MLVVSNTSPLTNLSAIGRLGLLRSLFSEIHIADGVWQELNAGGVPHPGAQEVGVATWIHRHSVSDRFLTKALRRDLDSGEAETITLAVELKADLVLMDEREGRHAAAHLGLQPLGVLGILLKSKQEGLLKEIRSSLDTLRYEAGFYVADQLYRTILDAAEESEHRGP